jgi:hypothetical protein
MFFVATYLPAETCATPYLLLQYPDELLATYI